MSSPPWIDELMEKGVIPSSRVKNKAEKDYLSTLLLVNVVRERVRGSRTEYVSDSKVRLDEFLKKKPFLAPVRPETRNEASLINGNSKLVKTTDGVVNYFFGGKADCTPELLACHISELSKKITQSTNAGPRITLIENLDVFMEWRLNRDFHEKALETTASDLYICTRGNELVRDSFIEELRVIRPSELTCAFDYDAAGLGFYKKFKQALKCHVSMPIPRQLDEAFQKWRRAEGAKNLSAGMAIDRDFAASDPTAAHILKLIDTTGVQVEQQSVIALFQAENTEDAKGKSGDLPAPANEAQAAPDLLASKAPKTI